MENNKIYNMNVFEFLNKVENKSIDLAIVDPPYNLLKNVEGDKFENSECYWNFTFKGLDLMLEKIKDNGSFYLFNTPFNSAIILNYLQSKNVYFRNGIVGYKKDGFNGTKNKYVNNQETILFFSMSNNYTFNYDNIRVEYISTSRLEVTKTKGILKNGKRGFPNEKGKLCSDVGEIVSERHNHKINGKIVKSLHPTPKPKKMIERMILASSNPKDLVLDLFSGTGISSIVAKENERNFIGCENNKMYYETFLSKI